MGGRGRGNYRGGGGQGIRGIGMRRPNERNLQKSFVHGGQLNQNGGNVVQEQKPQHVPELQATNQMYQAPIFAAQQRAAPTTLVQNQQPAMLQQNQQPANLQLNQQPANLQQNQQPANLQLNQQPANLQQNQQTANLQQNQKSPNLQQQVPPTSLHQIAELKISQVCNEIENVPLKMEPDGQENENGEKKKPSWQKKAVKLPKHERIRRRNMKLKKVLQPKNALMVLNELVGSTEYAIEEKKTLYNQELFSASITIGNETFTGTGKSKVLAKSAAAESAIRAITINKLKPQSDSTPQPDTPMDIDKQEEEDEVSWSHIASFAIHKLFSTWDETGQLLDMSHLSSSSSDINLNPTPNALQEQKAAKKLPENPEKINPIMLVNQMYPGVVKFLELSREGKPPHVEFTISCCVHENTFYGKGPNKKAAKRLAALQACRDLLKVQYPPEVLAELPQPLITI